MELKWCPNCCSCLAEKEIECPVCHIKSISISLEPQPKKEQSKSKAEE